MSTTLKRYGIVVGVDGSAASNAAVYWAAHEAALRNVPLTVVHMLRAFVPTYPQMPMPNGIALWQEEDGRQVLEQAVKIAEDVAATERPIAMTHEMKCSPPVPTLVEMSDDAEMVVVGSTGRGAVERTLLGSVSSGVVHSARCPVAVIRDEASWLPRSNRAPVVVGIDCSPVSELALAIAFDEASRRGVELTALHAWSDIAVYQLPWLDWQAEAERSLAEYLAGWQERYPDVKVNRVVVLDHPGRALIDESQTAQLVVVGSHGRGGLTGMLLGSVGNAVVHSVCAPVIVARPA
ncbi:universal stress protein [Mycobacterium angelicum]|uniref:Universal stress protein UspA n=1 Tax=Mycobacterium angelicum TaxID=470074 RepID=A0A1W9ZS39_MYCAN|nr:universal stress protein [Mycobacterium angelicum]MCV7199377.1 universal stress protein [Mycobacterium angelicum]ORA20475.1 universal stress protein UspA [Mycobacterium angelicum]